LGLIRGLGGNLNEKTKEAFAREVSVFFLIKFFKILFVFLDFQFNW
jgi:hypothetical protein